MVCWKWAGLTLLATLVLMFLPASSAVVKYVPGVRTGDWAQYDVQVLGDRSLVSGPYSFGSFIDTQYSKFSVTTVSGTILTISETIHYLNGTDYLFTTFNIDVNATEPNFVIAAGLNSPDELAPGSQYKLNSTEERTILGSSRAINYLNEYSDGSGVTVNEAWAWDKASGFPVAIVLTAGTSSRSETIILTISKTSLWATPTIFGLTPTLFYGITGVTLALAIGVAVFKLLRSRRRIDWTTY